MPRNQHLQALDDAISNTSLPRSSGTLEITAEESVICYGWTGDSQDHLQTARRLTLLNAPDDAVKDLADACSPAPFGRLRETLLDETYRKAGKLDTTQFLASFDVEKSGLVDRVRSFLLEGFDQGVSLRTELYKLNVYGPGSFFKAHRDTPRGTNMFASLVIVYPTKHEGGALVFRHEGKEFRFDSATEIQQAEVPSMAFVAFYSDMEHEVEPITSGYRVTLTYNIYVEPEAANAQVSITDRTPCEQALERAFRNLLIDPRFLQNGGVIGFGFRHSYPGEWYLKGTDAVLKNVCDKLGLKAKPKVLYKTYSMIAVCDRVQDIEGYRENDGDEIDGYILSEGSGKIVINGNEALIDDKKNDEDDKDKDDEDEKDSEDDYVNEDNDTDRSVLIYWATPKFAKGVSRTKEAYIGYGNEASLEYTYSHGCLLVDIPDAASRINQWGKHLEDVKSEGNVMGEGEGKEVDEDKDEKLGGV